MNDIKLNLTEGQIQNAVAVAIAEAFSPERRDALLRDIIRAQLTQPASNDRYSSNSETLLSKTVNEQLKEMVLEETRKQIGQLKPRVEELVAKKLGPQFKADVLTQLENQLGSIMLKDIRLSVSIGGRQYDD